MQIIQFGFTDNTYTFSYDCFYKFDSYNLLSSAKSLA